MRPRELALIATGGMVGTLARYGISRAAPVEPGRFPVTTFAINVAGAFVLGVLLEWLTRHRDLEHAMRFLVGVGALGAFTTFSAFMVDAVELVRHGHAALALGYAAATLLVGTAAALVGLYVSGWRPAATIPAEGES